MAAPGAAGRALGREASEVRDRLGRAGGGGRRESPPPGPPGLRGEISARCFFGKIASNRLQRAVGLYLEAILGVSSPLDVLGHRLVARGGGDSVTESEC